jgi:hypothetical protein
MGEVMQKVRGKIPGKIICKQVWERMNRPEASK